VHMEHQHTNRLAKEQSPYLLQHAHNPVSKHVVNDLLIPEHCAALPAHLGMTLQMASWCKAYMYVVLGNVRQSNCFHTPTKLHCASKVPTQSSGPVPRFREPAVLFMHDKAR